MPKKKMTLKEFAERYECCYLRSAKEELEEYEESLSKPKTEKVNAKEIERRRLAEERQRAEARRKRSGDSR